MQRGRRCSVQVQTKQAMDEENDGESLSEASYPSEAASFTKVTAVATEWMLDFLFVSLCKLFKEGKTKEFNDTVKAFEAISQSSSAKKKPQEKTVICAFLARVIHGKELDVTFDTDESVMPLMSAAKVWSKLDHVVEDEGLYKNITILLLVQSVAVCMEKGQRSSASSALKWFEKHQEFPQNLRAKLSTIVAQNDIYHPFLMNFSFSQLLKTIQSYLDTYLENNPSDFLIKAATTFIQSSKDMKGLEESASQNDTLSDVPIDSTQKEKKKKRKLLSAKMSDVWSPEITKNPHISLRRLSRAELSQMTSKQSSETSVVQKQRKPHQKWTSRLDKFLMEGVKRHGQGKWALILMDYDFEGRTGTMLKDRWRVLMKTHMVS